MLSGFLNCAYLIAHSHLLTDFTMYRVVYNIHICYIFELLVLLLHVYDSFAKGQQVDWTSG